MHQTPERGLRSSFRYSGYYTVLLSDANLDRQTGPLSLLFRRKVKIPIVVKGKKNCYVWGGWLS